MSVSEDYDLSKSRRTRDDIVVSSDALLTLLKKHHTIDEVLNSTVNTKSNKERKLC